jgi:hypothetical protein
VRDRLEAAGTGDAEADAVVGAYGDAQIDALKIGLLAAAGLSLIGLPFTRRLPRERLGRDDPDQEVAAAGPEPQPAPEA